MEENGAGAGLVRCSSSRKMMKIGWSNHQNVKMDDDDELMGKGKNKEKNKKRTMEGTQRQRLPNDMLSEILAKLPTKSLHRWKCVSKYWCSIMRSPRFFQDYIRHRGGLLLVSTNTTTAEEEESSTDDADTAQRAGFVL